MPIDYSFLQDAIPDFEEKIKGSGMSNVTIRVDADCYLQCDGEYIDVHISAENPVKIQLPSGQHLLEFISTVNPKVKIERAVDFPESEKNYLVLVNELSSKIAPAMPIEPNTSKNPSNPYLDQLNMMQGFNPLNNFHNHIESSLVQSQVPELPDENK